MEHSLEIIIQLNHELNRHLEIAAERGIDLHVHILRAGDGGSYGGHSYDQVRITRIIELA